MIKVATLDLDGVYFLDSHENFKANLLAKYGLTEDKVVPVYFGSQRMVDYKLGKINGDEFWDWAIKEWGIEATKEELLRVLAGGYFINDKAKSLMDKLHAQGILTAICTNNFLERIKVIDEKLNFLKDFDVKVFSYEAGVAKPDMEIYRELIRASGVKPDEIVYFDDSEDAVGAAKKLGIRAFFYKGFDEMVEQLKSLGANL